MFCALPKIHRLNKYGKVYFIYFPTSYLGTAVAQYYCATNRKVAVSIPDGVIGIYSTVLQIEKSLVRFQTVSLAFVAQCYCATNRKVAGSIPDRKDAVSIPDGVIGIFHRPNPPDSASNRNEYQEYFLGLKAAGA